MELRWKMGRANKGSPSIPKKLQYRFIERWVMKGENFGQPAVPEWSEWLDVPSVYARNDGDNGSSK